MDHYIVVPAEGTVIDNRQTADRRAAYLARSQGPQVIARVVSQVGDSTTEMLPDAAAGSCVDDIALARVREWYGALPEVQTVLRMAENWQRLCDDLRASGWRKFSPALIASVTPCVFPSCQAADNGLHG